MKERYDKVPENLSARLGEPGQFPFTRGIYPQMYSQGRLWTMRQYAGFASAEASNQRYRHLLEQGQTGLSVAFDLPTQLGLDPDDPMAKGEVGRVGVSIATIDDMERLLEQIPLDQVSTSMTINAPAMMLLALYIVVAERQGFRPEDLTGTVQNDILKEYIARGTYIYPTQPSMRLITDLFAYCAAALPKWNTISISGYHIREAGSTAAQEIAFTLANAKAYVHAALSAGLDIDQFGPRLSFFFACHNQLFEEVAKFRAARRMWASIASDEFGARDPKAQMMRFHTQTGGSTLTAQQPENNTVRTAYQALAAVLGGTQSLHTNALDEALGLPTLASARLALRSQQILGHETGVPEAVDPLAGSYYVEHLTDALEEQARQLIDHIDALGGSVKAIEAGFIQDEIEEAAYRHQQAIEAHEVIIVGVNDFQSEEDAPISVQAIDPTLEQGRRDTLAAFRANRDQQSVTASLTRLAAVARSDDNLFPVVLACFRNRATLGEVCGCLKDIWGEYQP